VFLLSQLSPKKCQALSGLGGKPIRGGIVLKITLYNALHDSSFQGSVLEV